MPVRNLLLALVGLFAVVAALFLLVFTGVESPGANGPGDPNAAAANADLRRAAQDVSPVTAELPPLVADPSRAEVEGGRGPKATGLRGIVLDETGKRPLGGVEVRAMRDPPGIERLISRFRGAFFEGNGMWTGATRPPRLLATTLTGPDGRFELLGVEGGLTFVDARFDFAYVRSPVQVRVADGEIRDGVELFASPAGRIRGHVRGSDGAPRADVIVSVRPGLNAFLGQLTQRRFGWIEGMTDADGAFDLYGVPPGTGYALAAAGRDIALEERYGIDVQEGKVTEVEITGHPGAFVAGQVFDPAGKPLANVSVAMVYLDVSRVLFSADGRAEPILTDVDGRFSIDHVAAGRIGFIAATDGLAPSEIVDLTVVDNGRYDDLRFTLGDGAAIAGIVVDDQEKPVPGALVEIRPFEQPRDPDVLKLVLKVRNVVAETDAAGRFVARGIDAQRVFLQASKAGYVTELRFNVKLEGEQKIVLTRGATVRGRVVGPDDKPIARFRVDTRSRPVRPADANATATPADAPAVDAPPNEERRFGPGSGRRGPPWARGDRDASMRLAAGQRFGEMDFDGNWTDVLDQDGRFELRGIPPGKIRVRVRAEGWRDPDSQEVELVAGAESAELTFKLEAGAIARGLVVEAGTRAPVAGAEVTAYRARSEEEGQRAGPFRINFQPEDFDFLGLAQGSRRTARADAQGRFEITGLAGGKHRFTARHPDLAKASSQDVELAVDQPTEGVMIEIDAGGAIEGRVTGAGRLPLRDALVVAASLQAGAFKSSSSDEQGNYRIEGLSPGQYIVFKSRIDEHAPNLGYDLLGNMRLKTVTVRRGKATKLDIQDESEGSVRVFGTVREGGQPVKRAMVTALGTDKEGLFGLGIRAQPTDEQGVYQLIGLSPGSYFFQVTRFAGRPQQANLSVDVPEGVREVRVDLDLPQSFVEGRVVDAAGNPVPRVQVSAGITDGDMADAPGLLGLIMKNGVAQTRSDENGAFKLSSVAPGTYRIVASGRGFGPGGRGGAAAEFGEAELPGVVVDGLTPVTGLVITLPRAGKIRGLVIDGNGAPLRGAELVASRSDAPSSLGAQEQMLDLFGVQARPVRSGDDGSFELSGLTPGTYRVRADAEGQAPGVADDVMVRSHATADVTITVIRGATLRLRARNVDGSQIPLAWISVFDGQGKPLASRVSTLSVLRRVLSAGDKVDDSGWREIGNVPPDHYTVVIQEPGKQELKVTRDIRDGETVEWDLDVSKELEAAGRGM
ncbi:MAG: carboxypeptidase regulatory-like domain-containing protein [Planctomycetes bacterium]|nr:carboxypeptidase regulatory-like domain-containing protein [Planctomycetota bacterium]